MNFLSRKARSVVPYTAGEQPQDKRYVKLNTNENPYPPSPRVQEALARFQAERLTLYPSPNADALRAGIAAAEGVETENVFCGNGSDEVLFLCFPAFFNADGAVCFPQITYSFYEVFAAFHGIRTVQVPLAEFSIDLQKLAQTPCEGYFIANPNAPTGVGIGRDEMERFIASVPEKLVIADEAYMDFFGESLVPLTKRYANLLVVKTFSKSYSLAGIRCGYAIGDPALIDGLFRMKDCMNSYPLDAVCQAVCLAAIGDSEYRDRTAALVRAERERVRNELLRLGFTVPESKANFLFAGRARLGGGEIYSRLKEEGVLVRFWDKPFLRDFCRITIGTREQNDILLEKLNLILK